MIVLYTKEFQIKKKLVFKMGALILLLTSFASWLEWKVRDSYGTSGQVETPKGAKRQEAHRSPHGKRATWNGNQLYKGYIIR